MTSLPMTRKQTSLISTERIERAILVIRGQKVMLDSDLAALYGVETGHLNRAVARNAARFPSDFMFQLSEEEVEILKCQFGISSSGWGGRRRSLPYAFTEQGVAMLSSVLRSPQAVSVNIEIMRAFVRLRHWAATNAELARRIDELEKKYDGQFTVIFDALRKLTAPPGTNPREMGYHTLVRRPAEKAATSRRRA